MPQFKNSNATWRVIFKHCGKSEIQIPKISIIRHNIISLRCRTSFAILSVWYESAEAPPHQRLLLLLLLLQIMSLSVTRALKKPRRVCSSPFLIMTSKLLFWVMTSFLLIAKVRSDASSMKCQSTKLVVYQVTFKTFWDREKFPKQYPEWRPPAQWSKLIGKTNNIWIFAPKMNYRHIVWKLLKISHLNFWILAFSTNFCPIKTDLSGNTVWPQALGFQKLAKMDHFRHF